MPTCIPTAVPTAIPSAIPSAIPTVVPTDAPTNIPTVAPTFTPGNPTVQPSTAMPTCIPTAVPTAVPSTTDQPSLVPSVIPSTTPSELPSTLLPSTIAPSEAPTEVSTNAPLPQPSTSPTSQPSGAPTVQQTKAIKSNEFINASSEEVQVKVKYYMVTFCGFFVAMFLFLVILDKSVSKRWLNRLHDSAYESKMYKKDGTSDRRDYLETLPVRNKLNQLAIDERFVASLVDSVSVKNMRKISKDPSFHQNKTQTGISGSGDLTLYDDAFYQYLLQKRCLIGCAGILYPAGFKLNLLIQSYHLREGVVEDFILFLCNNHSLLSCIYRVRGSPISRNACRILYLVQNSIAFFMSALNNLIFAYAHLDPNFGYLSDLIIVAPASIFLGSVILELYTCRIVNSTKFAQGSCGKYGKFITFVGKLMVIPFILLIFVLLILAALCTQSSNVYSVTLSFVWQVQLQSVVLEFLYALVLFNSAYFYQMRVLGIPVVEMGSIFAERVLKCIQPEYYMYYTSMMGGFIAVDLITNKVVPNKPEIISTKPKDVYVPDGIEAPQNRITLYDNYGDDSGYELSTLCHNPLFTASHSQQAVIPESELTTHSSFSNDFSETHRVRVDETDQVQAPRPQFNLLQALQRPLQKTKLPNISKDVDSDDSLREEFQEFQLTHQDSPSNDDMSSNLSFEEWKIERKELKGVGEHYENAFRFFERKEQEAGIAIPKVTSSVQRAMGIHNALDNKNNPLSRKRHSAGNH